MRRSARSVEPPDRRCGYRQAASLRIRQRTPSEGCFLTFMIRAATPRANADTATKNVNASAIVTNIEIARLLTTRRLVDASIAWGGHMASSAPRPDPLAKAARGEVCKRQPQTLAVAPFTDASG